MVKDVPYGAEVEKVVETKGEPVSIRVNLFVEVYDRETLLSEIRPQVNVQGVTAEQVLLALESTDIFKANRDTWSPMQVLPPTLRGECPSTMYIPRLRTVTVTITIPTTVSHDARGIIPWLENGATSDGRVNGPKQLQSRISRCSAILGYARYLTSGNVDTFPVNLGIMTTYTANVAPTIKTVSMVKETIRVPTHVATLRWGCSKNTQNNRYRKAREIAVFYTPETKETIDNKERIIEILSALMDCVLNELGYSPISVLTSNTGFGYANPYSPELLSGKARFEVAETTLNKKDGQWEYIEYDIFDTTMINENKGTFDDFRQMPYSTNRPPAGIINVNECLNSKGIKWR